LVDRKKIASKPILSAINEVFFSPLISINQRMQEAAGVMDNTLNDRVANEMRIRTHEDRKTDYNVRGLISLHVLLE